MSENSNSSPTRKYSLWEELTAAEGGKFIGNYSLQEYKVMRGFIPSQGQLVKLYYTKFEPREPLASVAIIHGVGEGHESFMGLGGRLAEQGLAVHTIDFRGFGFSGGERGSYVFKDYMRDIEALINCCKRSIPLYVYAHGIGACILLTMLALNPGLPVSGVITTSLMTSLPCESPSLLRSLVLATPFFDELVMSTNVSPTSLTKQPAKYSFEQCSHLMSLRMVRELQRYKEFLEDSAYYFNYPVFMIHGKRDTVSPFESSLSIFKALASKEKTIRIFEHGYHELHNDRELPQLADKVVEWIRSKQRKAVPLSILPRLQLSIPAFKLKGRHLLLLFAFVWGLVRLLRRLTCVQKVL